MPPWSHRRLRAFSSDHRSPRREPEPPRRSSTQVRRDSLVTVACYRCNPPSSYAFSARATCCTCCPRASIAATTACSPMLVAGSTWPAHANCCRCRRPHQPGPTMPTPRHRRYPSRAHRPTSAGTAERRCRSWTRWSADRPSGHRRPPRPPHDGAPPSDCPPAMALPQATARDRLGPTARGAQRDPPAAPKNQRAERIPGSCGDTRPFQIGPADHTPHHPDLSNPHSTPGHPGHRGAARGFLPGGLSDACPLNPGEA